MFMQHLDSDSHATNRKITRQNFFISTIMDEIYTAKCGFSVAGMNYGEAIECMSEI